MKRKLDTTQEIILGVLVLLLLGLISVWGIQEAVTAQTPVNPKIQILLPLYRYPEWYNSSYLWDDVAAANQRVPITFIINPNSGPDGGPPNADYVRGMSDLRAAGVKMIGYVLTDYGNRNIDAVLADIDLYDIHFSSHGLTGIFFDEVTNTADKIAYYEQLYNYVKAKKNLTQVFLNPGAGTDELYVSRPAGDVVVIYDDTASKWPSEAIASYVANYPANRFGAVIYSATTSVTTMKAHVDLAIARNINYLYITNDGGVNPWDTLPAFWNDLLTYMQQINAAATLTPTATPTASPTKTATSTATATATPTGTAPTTDTATPSPTPTGTNSVSTDPTATATATSTATPTLTASPTPPPSATHTPTNTPTTGPGSIHLAIVSNAPTPTPQPSWQRVGQGGLEVASLELQGNQLFAGDRRAFAQNGGLYSRSLSACANQSDLERIGSIPGQRLECTLSGRTRCRGYLWRQNLLHR